MLRQVVVTLTNLSDHTTRTTQFQQKWFSEMVQLHQVLHKSYLFVVAAVYLKRLITRRGLKLTAKNIKTLFQVALMIAHKFWNDYHLQNNQMAAYFKLPTIYLNSLEREMLFQLDFDCNI